MANIEQLRILKLGVDVWNQWRESNFGAEIDLSGANLSREYLKRVNLQNADLKETNFREADLREANLIKVDLTEANLTGANLIRIGLVDAILRNAKLVYADIRDSYLNNTNLSNVDLSNSNLSSAYISNADLNNANLRKTNLSGANLSGSTLNNASLNEADLNNAKLNNTNLSSVNFNGANLSGADLNGSNLSRAVLADTIFGNNDLREVIGLKDVTHRGPSTIGIDTISISKGKIPEQFLRGCGLKDWEVELTKLYNENLTNHDMDEILYRVHDIHAHQPVQVSPLFISYSHDDGTFIDKLENHLNNKGVRFWRDVHDATSGRLEKVIDRAIRLNPTVLLILSKHSLKSDWVEHEVRTARELEKEIGRDVLCPVALDDSWKDGHWPKRVMEQVMEYNILDFSAWEDDGKFDGMFSKLIDGLELFYKGYAAK